MKYVEYQRYNLYGLTLTRVSHYEHTLNDGRTIIRWRYAFINTRGEKFVYTGVKKNFIVGVVYHIRGTVKIALDKYGYTRLLRVVSLGKEKTLLEAMERK